MTGESTSRYRNANNCIINNGQSSTFCDSGFDSPQETYISYSYHHCDFQQTTKTTPSDRTMPRFSFTDYVDSFMATVTEARGNSEATVHSDSRLAEQAIFCHSEDDCYSISFEVQGQEKEEAVVEKEEQDTVAIHLATKKKYKPVALKVRPVIGELPAKFRIIRNIIGDPLRDLPKLTPHPPTFIPTGRYTQERKELFDKLNPGFLWPVERKLMHHFMMLHNEAFAWEPSERGHFREDFFPPIDIPVIPHKPWVQRNIPIPPGLYDELCRIVKEKLDAGTFEPSNSSYRSRWFCVVKKDGKSLRIVQSLEPLNQVTIAHSGVPPFTEQLAEHFAGRACNSMMDLYVGYDERALAPSSRDLTTFQTPFGALRLTTLPMGWTNSVPIFHDDVTHILRPEIPHVTQPYIDDVPVRGPATRYIQENGEPETIPENEGIRRFVWEHFQDLNRVVQRMKFSGGTFSGYKTTLCAAEITVLGHRCTMQGRLPDQTRVGKIVNWGPCKVDGRTSICWDYGGMQAFYQEFRA